MLRTAALFLSGTFDGYFCERMSRCRLVDRRASRTASRLIGSPNAISVRLATISSCGRPQLSMNILLARRIKRWRGAWAFLWPNTRDDIRDRFHGNASKAPAEEIEICKF